MTDLHYLTATEALAKFRSRELSPVELMEATIARAEAVEPDINAFCLTYYERALEQAKAAEAVYARNPDDARPLEGLPVGLKDEVEIDGEPATQASLAFKDLVAEETTPIGERILEAGGIIHARTTTPEFSLRRLHALQALRRHPQPVEPALRGRRLAPAGRVRRWPPAPQRSPAARTSAARSASRRRSTASSGSSRRYGRVPVELPFNMDTLLPQRSAGAHRRRLRAVRERARRSAPARPHLAAARSSRSPRRSTASRACASATPSTSAAGRSTPRSPRNTRDAAEALRDAGAVVDEVELDHRPRAAEQGRRRALPDDVRRVDRQRRRGARRPAQRLRDRVRPLHRRGQARTCGSSTGWCIETEIWKPIGELFERYDVLIAPTIGDPRAGGRRGLRRQEPRGRRRDARQLLRRAADAGVQHVQPLPGAERAVRLRRQRRPDRAADRRAHLSTT